MPRLTERLGTRRNTSSILVTPLSSSCCESSTVKVMGVFCTSVFLLSTVTITGGSPYGVVLLVFASSVPELCRGSLASSSSAMATTGATHRHAVIIRYRQ